MEYIALSRFSRNKNDRISSSNEQPIQVSPVRINVISIQPDAFERDNSVGESGFFTNISRRVGSLRNGFAELKCCSVTKLKSLIGYTSWKNGYLEAFLKIEYLLGLSPFKIEKSGHIVTNGLRKILYIIYNGLALVNVLISMKITNWFVHQEAIKKKSIFYIHLGFMFTIAISKLIYANLLLKCLPKISKLIEKIRKSSFHSELHTPRITILTILFRITSIICGIMMCVLGLDVLTQKDKWSMSNVLSEQATTIRFLLGRRLVQALEREAWNNYSNATLEAENVNDINTGTYIFGCAGIFISVLDTVTVDSIHNFILFLTLTIWKCCEQLRQKKTFPRAGASLVDSGRRISAERSIQAHGELRKISKATNALLENLLPMIASAAVMSSADLIQSAFDGNWYEVVFLLFQLVKVVAIFYFGLRISGKMGSFYMWMTKKKTQEILQLGEDHLQRTAIEMNFWPIGIGSGIFYINQRFLASCLTFAGTYLLLLVEYREAK